MGVESEPVRFERSARGWEEMSLISWSRMWAHVDDPVYWYFMALERADAVQRYPIRIVEHIAISESLRLIGNPHSSCL